MSLYHGGCQCGAVRFSAELSLEQPVICNCSRCRRLGSVLVFAPVAGFTVAAVAASVGWGLCSQFVASLLEESGAAELSDYLFNKQVIRHRFCRICGIESFSEGRMPDGTAMVAVNVNCLDGVDARECAARAFAYDGASL